MVLHQFDIIFQFLKKGSMLYLFLVEHVKLRSILKLEGLVRRKAVVPNMLSVEKVRWDVPARQQKNTH